MYSISRNHHNVPLSLIEEFMSKGGQITKCPTGERTEDIEYTGGFYGKRKKKAETVDPEVSDDES
jgi:hypothetical protein